MNNGSSLACSQKPALVPTLSQTNPVHTLPAYLGSIQNIIIQTTSMSSNGLFLQNWAPNPRVQFSFITRAPHAPPISHSLIWSPKLYVIVFRDPHLQRGPGATTLKTVQQAPPKRWYL